MDVYRCVINWEYAMYKGPDNQIKNYSTDWESVTKTIYDHESFGGQLSKTGYFENDINALIANTPDKTKRIALIYDFVKSKVAWNDYYGDYAEKGVRKAYKEGSGNVGDINLMLTAMLRYAGLNANPVLISTKSHGIPLFPTRNGFNYVIAAVELPNQLVLLDATDRYAMPNILPKRAINWQGRIVREHGSSAWIDLMHPLGVEESYALQVKFNDDFSAEGRVRAQLKNTSAMRFRTEYSAMGTDERLQDLEEGKGEIEIENYKVKNEDILSAPSLQYSYSFKLQNAGEIIGEKIYISPMLFFASAENEFKEEERVYPLEFTYPSNYSYNISLILPEGYKVEALPESSKVKFNGEEAEFTYMAVQDGSRVVLKVNFDINNTFVLANDYKQFKDFVGMMVNKETEKLILVKDGLAGTE
ncbi:transglutaminase domain-containing protein [Formosa sp. A9]|uniref:transglutaminase domain-containing protein n=1 Tax=Formosa sp. A9 TaxID=3442641 RepID=UPI003EBD7C4D